MWNVTGTSFQKFFLASKCRAIFSYFYLKQIKITIGIHVKELPSPKPVSNCYVIQGWEQVCLLFALSSKFSSLRFCLVALSSLEPKFRNSLREKSCKYVFATDCNNHPHWQFYNHIIIYSFFQPSFFADVVVFLHLCTINANFYFTSVIRFCLKNHYLRVQISQINRSIQNLTEFSLLLILQESK